MDFSQFRLLSGGERIPLTGLARFSSTNTPSEPAYFMAGKLSIEDTGMVTDEGGLLAGADIPLGGWTRLGVAGGVTKAPDGRTGRSLALYGTQWLNSSVMAEWTLGAGFGGGTDLATGFGGAGLHWNWEPSDQWRAHAEADVGWAWSNDASEAGALGATLDFDVSYRTMVGDTAVEVQSRAELESTGRPDLDEEGLDLALTQGIRVLPRPGVELSLNHSLVKSGGGEPAPRIYIALRARL